MAPAGKKGALQELLHRVKWDAQFARSMFAVGYYDRVAREERVVPFASISIDPGGRSFTLVDADEVAAQIPLHRVRTVYQDGRVIWRRQPREQPTS